MEDKHNRWRGWCRPRDIWLLAMAVIATLAYLLASGFLSLTWGTYTLNPDEAPLLSRLAVMPCGKNPVSYLWHWHLLALCSLLGNTLLSLRLRRQGLEASSPFVAHLAWLLFAWFMHLSGFSASMVSVVYVLE